MVGSDAPGVATVYKNIINKKNIFVLSFISIKLARTFFKERVTTSFVRQSYTFWRVVD